MVNDYLKTGMSIAIVVGSASGSILLIMAVIYLISVKRSEWSFDVYFADHTFLVLAFYWSVLIAIVTFFSDYIFTLL